jgi:hypothetical protein
MTLQLAIAPNDGAFQTENSGNAISFRGGGSREVLY